MKLFFGSDILVRNRVAYNMTLLTMSGVVAKTIDFSFRAYYSRHLGAEGMGIYSLIMSVFGMVLSLSSAGMGVAVSNAIDEVKDVADAIAGNNDEDGVAKFIERKILKSS